MILLLQKKNVKNNIMPIYNMHMIEEIETNL